MKREIYFILFVHSIILVMATVEFYLSEFHSEPSAEALHLGLNRSVWIKLAEVYEVPIGRFWIKAKIMEAEVSFLVENEIIDKSAMDLCDALAAVFEAGLRIKEQEQKRVKEENRRKADEKATEYKKRAYDLEVLRKKEAHELLLFGTKAELLLFGTKAELGITGSEEVSNNEESYEKFDIYINV